MNFAAQFFYSRFQSERPERLHSPQPAMTDCMENDPFWQRWETAADLDTPDPKSPDLDSLDPGSPGPDSPGPESSGPESPGPESPGPESPGPESSGPESPGPESPGSESPGPESSGPESPGSESPGPESPGPESPGPESPGPESPGPESPGSESPGPESLVNNNPVEAAPTPSLPKETLPPPLDLEEQQNPASVSGLPQLSPPSSRAAPPPPAALPEPSPCLLTKEQPGGTPTPRAGHTEGPPGPTAVTQTTGATPGSRPGTPCLNRAQESELRSESRISPWLRVPSRAWPCSLPSLPTRPARSAGSPPAPPPGPLVPPPSSANPCPFLTLRPASVGGLFRALVSFLLRLVLSFVLLILPSEELRLGPSHQRRGSNRSGPGVANGALGRRPTLIEPERLKDFGEEELLNGDMRVWEAWRPPPPPPPQAPEVQMTMPPKIRRLSAFKARPQPSTEHLRFEDISAAAFKIQSAIQKTPCTYSRLSKQYGLEIYLKKEHLHYTGSVKERGVFYLLTSLTQEQQKKGVIVATDCNFSMAVAHHAVELKIPVFAIMPSCCSVPRLRVYRDYGAMVISYGTAARDSRSHACHLAKDNGYLYLEEDEQEAYLAGLGTVGMEIYEQVPKLDAVVVPASGQFGLLAGTAAALKHLNPRILVVGVEPEGYPLLLQSLKTGGPFKDMTSRPNSKLYGDVAEHSLGPHTFQLVKKHVDKVITVSEETSLVAMLRFQEFERSTVDTEGATGLAAILSGQLPELRGKKVAVVVSSANMELDLVRQCVERALVLDERISRFTVEMSSLPGDMAKLLDFLSREDVRLLDVCHRRHSEKTELFRTQVECVVETRDKTQSVLLRKTLCERYPSLHWLDR